MTRFYNVQCPCGHVGSVHYSSPLGTRAADREARGFLDALTIPCSECAECSEEMRQVGRLCEAEVSAQESKGGLPSKADRDAADRAFDAETHGDEY